MATKGKSNKVYRVHTALAETASENELPHWSKYVVIACDAQEAITTARPKFNDRSEYAESVELLAVLSE
jgi:1,2-phenylacetyl-CoA epoxidase PaaB subunit